MLKWVSDHLSAPVKMILRTRLILNESKREAVAYADSVRRELRRCADACDRYHQNGSIQTTMAMLNFDAWDNAEPRLHAYLTSDASDPDLWPDLTEAYDELRATKAHGRVPPQRASLESLSDRLGQWLARNRA